MVAVKRIMGDQIYIDGKNVSDLVSAVNTHHASHENPTISVTFNNVRIVARYDSDGNYVGQKFFIHQEESA